MSAGSESTSAPGDIGAAVGGWREDAELWCEFEEITGCIAFGCGSSLPALAAAIHRWLVDHDGAPTAGAVAELGWRVQQAVAIRARSVAESEHRRLDGCERGLTRLRRLTTTAELIDGVCDTLSHSSGFGRVMLARVQDMRWWPWKANAGVLRQRWSAEWLNASISLDAASVERRLLQCCTPELVSDTTVPGIAGIVRAAGVHSYVVAPIVSGGRVIGFLHADHGAEGRSCDLVDRSMMWVFAEEFARIYERNVLLEQLGARRARLEAAVADLERGLDEVLARPLFGEYGLGWPGPAGPGVRGGAHADERVARLTAREREVLELVADGARNSEIAESLGIAAVTVKTHVTRILVKLGVENRAQAIALRVGAGPVRKQG
ncbi:helix-turn-helix transcriptional regulator [Nocardia sp. NPDC004123]